MPAPTTPEEYEIQFQNDIGLLHQFLHGTTSEVVVTEGGNLPTLAKLASRSNTQFLQLAGSDMTTALVAASRVTYARVVNAGVFNTIRLALALASSSGSVSVDVKINGVSCLSTLFTIDQGETTSVTAAVPGVISSGEVSDDDEISIDIVNAGVGAKGLTITLLTV